MKHFPEVVEHVELLMMIQKTFPESSQKQWEQLYQDVFKCVANKTYVSGRRNFQCRGRIWALLFVCVPAQSDIIMKYIVFTF